MSARTFFGGENMKDKVLVGMSGGVDSSVAAYLLKDKYEVVGVTLCLHGYCGSAIEDARRVCENLGIGHYVADKSYEFKQYVINNFIDEYRNARTPNPCVWCNYHIKFGEMLKLADQYGCKYLATGHYVTSGFDDKEQEYYLCPAKYDDKDQTYALYRLKQSQIARSLFPVGELKKDEVRAIAQKIGLIVAQKKDSQEICFIPDHDYAAYIEREIGESSPGDFIGPNGEVLGRHKGLIHYTVGQRRGLEVAYGERIYVAKIDNENNTVILGTDGVQNTKQFWAKEITFISDKKPPLEFDCQAKIRYNGKAAPAHVTIDGESMIVQFEEDQRAAAPGQSVVLYNNGRLLGGGIIEAR